MRWAASVQRELLKVDWPKGLLEWAECAPDYDEDGALLWRGPRVKVGMAVGHDAAKRPLNTGATVGFGSSIYTAALSLVCDGSKCEIHAAPIDVIRLLTVLL